MPALGSMTGSWDRSVGSWDRDMMLRSEAWFASGRMGKVGTPVVVEQFSSLEDEEEDIA